MPYRWRRLAPASASALLQSPSPSRDLLAHPEQQDARQGNDGLRIQCLGEFRVFRGSVELKDSDWGQGKGPTLKIKALLAFLLHRKARGARKEVLLDLLWPQQTDPKRANSSFHQAVFYLRRALEPDLEDRTPSSYIRHRGERYYFAPRKPYWVDVEAFVDCADRAHALQLGGDVATAVEFWSRATDLYRGEFMAGIEKKYTCSEYYDWCTTANFRFEQLFLTATMAVARHQASLGHHGLAIKRAREALQVEPTLESAHRLLIRCLMETNQWEQALGQYRLCRAELEFHHDRPPSDQTDLLFQQLVESIRSA